MIDPAYSKAMAHASAQAKRQGLIIHHVSWRAGHLSWMGRPKREAAALVAEEPEFIPRGRGLCQGQLL